MTFGNIIKSVLFANFCDINVTHVTSLNTVNPEIHYYNDYFINCSHCLSPLQLCSKLFLFAVIGQYLCFCMAQAQSCLYWCSLFSYVYSKIITGCHLLLSQRMFFHIFGTSASNNFSPLQLSGNSLYCFHF